MRFRKLRKIVEHTEFAKIPIPEEGTTFWMIDEYGAHPIFVCPFVPTDKKRLVLEIGRYATIASVKQYK